MKLSDAVNRVIDLAGKVRDYYDTELPKRHPNYPLVGPDEEGPPPPPEEKELRDFLSTLPEELVYQLLQIMSLGRGDVGPDELTGDCETLRRTFGGLEYAIPEMMDNAALADELLDGLEELSKHKINVDRLPLKRVKQRKR